MTLSESGIYSPPDGLGGGVFAFSDGPGGFDSVMGSNYAKPEYPRKRVNWAGDMLLNPDQASDDELDHALDIISNWRSSHARPLLGARMTLTGRARSVDIDPLIAQRQKRLSSIAVKLRRNPNMKLSQMQDIGGCRAVVRNVAALRSLYAAYMNSNEKSPKHRPECCEVYDYLTNPKPDGYRGIHLVYKYRTGNADLMAYDGLRIEVQLRSHLQHLWATAVETVDVFTRQALKSGLGTEPWKRFFALMGSAIAFRERAPRVPNTPRLKPDLLRELRAQAARLHVVRALENMGAVVEFTQQDEPQDPDAKLFLLELNSVEMKTLLWRYREAQQTEANDMYLEREKLAAGNPAIQVVLVSVESLAGLPKAYPNYYLDTREFVGEVRRAIAFKSE